MIAAGARPFNQPQVWHFAFKSPLGIFREWRPYGFVEVFEDQISLFHFNGHMQVVPRPRDGRFIVETYFGEGSADFRVASLHPFTLEQLEAPDPRLAVVRFP